MVMINSFNSACVFLSFLSFSLYYASESSKCENTLKTLAFIHKAPFILDSLPTLDIWPCKTHNGVMIFFKCFCYKSVI